ncbi:MAG TPA: hypothetical protein VG501_06310, partial [Rhizomicrobium sp.]|nr:hypothetical protein [Rhizomicrobium sp.]
MTKVKSIALGTAAAIFASSAAIPAQATTALYGGGSTLVEKVERDIMNCYGAHGGGPGTGDLTANLGTAPSGCNTATPYNANVE